ncbi:SsgA family sporulation/cell division regulator [Streptomyces sp. NPDC060194]|uniref:SsgA family sporulation/cell division regulator n=1 Tax=Streptomyces sp. NPDC060194 TaxID=3347069 RepID=UPI003655CD3E
MILLPALRQRLHRAVVALGRRETSSRVPHTCLPHRTPDAAPMPVSSLPVRLHCEHGSPVPLLMALRYDRHDPFAVLLAFHGPGGWSAQWRLPRDLLMTGSETDGVHGDVQVWPSLDGVGQEILLMRLGTDEDNALIEVRRGPLRHWLAHTYTAVPAGSEMAGVDWSEEMRQLARGL